MSLTCLFFLTLCFIITYVEGNCYGGRHMMLGGTVLKENGRMEEYNDDIQTK